jgi:hypothetical protein
MNINFNSNSNHLDIKQFESLEHLLEHGKHILLQYEQYHRDHLAGWPQDEQNASLQIIGLLNLFELEMNEFIEQKLTIQSAELKDYLAFAVEFLGEVAYGITH